MKIRNGFVSNSSSSSFVISTDRFPTVRSLAKYMIKKKIKEEDYNDYDNNTWKEDSHNWDKKYLKRLNNIDENAPVSFPSCNYDTYIRKIGDCYLVATCNNTDWNLYSYNTSMLTEKAKVALKELKKSYSKGSDDRREIKDILNGEIFYSFGSDFYDLNEQIIGVETYDYCPNTTNHNNYTHLWNTLTHGKICLKCEEIRKEKLGILKEKIETLNSISDED